MQRAYYFYIISILALLLSACANQVIPTGGIEDELPPFPKSYSPDSNSVFFDEDEIVIVFDEYFQAADIFNQLVISPPMDIAPDIKVKGKKLIIKLKSPLRDSTTYTINFGESIKDITQNNVLENFTYVFSTGSYIDSLQISGTVTDPATGKPAEKIYVVLYPPDNDTAFTNAKPYYFAKTNAAGNYTIRNIREGLYHLYAIEDQNFNYYYDLPNERIAFSDSLVKIDSGNAAVDLQLFSEEKLTQHLLSAKSYRFGQSKIAFSKNAEDVKIEYAGASAAKGFFEKNNTGDTITFWHPDVYLNTHIFHIQFDSIDTILTVVVKGLAEDSSIVKNKNSYSSNADPLKRGNTTDRLVAGWDVDRDLQMIFRDPLDTIYPEQFILQADSLPDSIIPELYIDTLNRNILHLHYAWKPDTKYILHITAQATKDIYGLYNDSITYFIQTKKSEEYGFLKINITNTFDYPVLVQFMKKDLTLLEEKKILPSQTLQLQFPNLSPDKYSMRAIADKNDNGKWDTGNLNDRRQPEKIFYYPAEIATKANWEIELKWEIK